MAEAEFPVDPANPGQVLACLGFMELAEILFGDAEGGFDWSDPSAILFRLRARGEVDPVFEALTFLDGAELRVIAPQGIDGEWPAGAEPSERYPGSGRADGAGSAKPVSASALPVRLVAGGLSVPIGHWADESKRETFKLFAGQQKGAAIMADLLGHGKAKADELTVRYLLARESGVLAGDPFTETGPTPSSFGFDARGAWDALRAGAGLDALKIAVRVSPVVEVLAPIGLEHARPLVAPGSQVRYAIWSGFLPISLARAALSAATEILPRGEVRWFRTHLGPSKYYKKFYYAIEE